MHVPTLRVYGLNGATSRAHSGSWRIRFPEGFDGEAILVSTRVISTRVSTFFFGARRRGLTGRSSNTGFSNCSHSLAGLGSTGTFFLQAAIEPSALDSMAPKGKTALIEIPSSDDDTAPLIRPPPAPRDAPGWIPVRARRILEIDFQLDGSNVLVSNVVSLGALCFAVEYDRALWALDSYDEAYAPRFHLAMVFSRKGGAATRARQLGYEAVTFDPADGNWQDAQTVGGLLNLAHIVNQMRAGGLVWLSPPDAPGSELSHVVCYIIFLARMRLSYAVVSAPLKSDLFKAHRRYGTSHKWHALSI